MPVAIMDSATDAAAPDVPGVLLVLNDILEASEEEFNRWYQQQHVPERLAVPGFKTARRYRVVDGGRAYMAVYECESIGVLASETYLERLGNPSDWTRRVLPGFRKMLRAACRETWSAGDADEAGLLIDSLGKYQLICARTAAPRGAQPQSLALLSNLRQNPA